MSPACLHHMVYSQVFSRYIKCIYHYHHSNMILNLVSVCVVLQAVASVEARPVAVVRGAHAVTASTATCHPLHRCPRCQSNQQCACCHRHLPSHSFTNNSNHCNACTKKLTTLNTAPPLATLLMRSAYQLYQPSSLSIHTSPTTQASSMLY